jgi:hypothetical protein
MTDDWYSHSCTNINMPWHYHLYGVSVCCHIWEHSGYIVQEACICRDIRRKIPYQPVWNFSCVLSNSPHICSSCSEHRCSQRVPKNSVRPEQSKQPHLQYYTLIQWHVVTQLVRVLRYKMEGHGLDSWWCHRHNPSTCTMAWGSTQPLTEMSTRNISWG